MYEHMGIEKILFFLNDHIYILKKNSNFFFVTGRISQDKYHNFSKKKIINNGQIQR